MADDKLKNTTEVETFTFIKTCFNSAMENVMFMQEQYEKLLTAIMDQAETSGAEGRKVIVEWMNIQKKGLEEFKKLTSQNISILEKFFKGK